MPTPSSIVGRHFRIGRNRRPHSGKWLDSQDAHYILDPDLGPLLEVSWNKPGFFGGVEAGRFIFKTDCYQIGIVPKSRTAEYAKDAAAAVVPRTFFGLGGAIGSSPVSALVRIARQRQAACAEQGFGVTAVEIYYKPPSEESKTLGLFAGIAESEILNEIFLHMPADRVFAIKEKSSGQAKDVSS